MMTGEGVYEMREKIIERKLAVAVKQAGGMALKFVSPGFDGMPDRIVLLPDEHIAFVEVKASGKKPRPLQLARHRLLRKLGFPVYVIDSADQIGGMLDEIRAT
jgi:acetoacetate decarboxylase